MFQGLCGGVRGCGGQGSVGSFRICGDLGVRFKRV